MKSSQAELKDPWYDMYQIRLMMVWLPSIEAEFQLSITVRGHLWPSIQ